MTERTPCGLYAISDLHVGYQQNRDVVDRVFPVSEADWLIVAGDVGEHLGEIERTLSLLRDRFAKVIWVPGNHELWTLPGDDGPRGVARYDHLVEMCRGLGVTTPEDPFPVWKSATGPVRIAPMFLLYDYSYLTPGTSTVAESLHAAVDAGVVCTDEYLLHSTPFPTRADWCRSRIALTEGRLAAVAGKLPLVMVNHWPTVREPTKVLNHQEFAQWCGTEMTADWHIRFGARVVVYGHLHIPRSSVYDGVRFEEVSIGYPREWQRFGLRDDLARLILPGAPL